MTKLKQIRLNKNLTQVEFAELLNISQATLSRMEQNIQDITPEVARNAEIVADGKISRLELLYPQEYQSKRKQNTVSK